MDQIEICDQNHENFRKLKKNQNFRSFENIEDFRKFCSRRDLSQNRLWIKLENDIGLVRELGCSTLRREKNILSCTHQAQYVMTSGTQKAHVPVVCNMVCLMCAHTAEVRDAFTNRKHGQFPVQRC